MGVTDRPLLIPTPTRSRSRPFQSFLEGILTAFLLVKQKS
uniref:Uncharacterized protein n=1 Tax=Heterorhabditis bacteriophora TaxID=37862 RepID=A0A1I7WG85_HETBA